MKLEVRSRGFTPDFGQMMYKVNGENIAVRASCPLRGVPHSEVRSQK